MEMKILFNPTISTLSHGSFGGWDTPMPARIQLSCSVERTSESFEQSFSLMVIVAAIQDARMNVAAACEGKTF
jgi:hypothetical protein